MSGDLVGSSTPQATCLVFPAACPTDCFSAKSAFCLASMCVAITTDSNDPLKFRFSE